MLERKTVSIHPILLTALSGILLWLCWPTSPLTLLVFVAWIPLFWLESQSTRLVRFWGLTYLTMLLWNEATTWWVSNTTVPISGILAAVLNSLIMTVPWIGFWKAKRKFGPVIGYTALVAYWLCFEYIHLNWELSWPWLTLGNVFASRPGWVQWYEWTGSSGGTLWVWVVNIGFFEALRRRKASRDLLRTWGPVALVFILPLFVSVGINAYRAPMSNVPVTGPDIVVVQPNIDPYNEKFDYSTTAQQMQELISLSESKIDSSTAVVVWPETAIPYEVDEPLFNQTRSLEPMRAFLRRHPSIELVTGLAGSAELPPGTTTPAMRMDSATGRYYEEYNSAVETNASGEAEIYHKGKLVPGAEIIPYTWLFGFLEKLSLDMGGTSGTLGRGKERIVFTNPHNDFKIAPIICYESIYSAYVTGYIRKGANVLTIITNDGWWGDTQGYRQHQQYARLRAIEDRRWVCRSANTGISCFIDPLGKVYQAQPWNTASAIKMVVPSESVMTLYARLGDWIAMLAVLWTICVQSMGIYTGLTKNK